MNARSTLLGDIGEFGWIRRLVGRSRTAKGVLCGPGDDAAAFRLDSPILVTTDVLIEGVHFRRGWGTCRQLGRRAFAVSASDIAAMGGRPAYALMDLRAPPTFRVHDLEEIYRGFGYEARRHQTVLIGGNTSRSRDLSLAVTLLGRAPAGYVRRDGCRVGDDLYVTGTLGGAALGLAALRAGCVGDATARRFLVPPSRVDVAVALTRTRMLGGMIDVSDGFVQDLEHLCSASRVGACVDAARIPLSRSYRTARGADPTLALSGGEDYELLFSARAEFARYRDRLRSRYRCPLTRIGMVEAARDGVRLRRSDGSTVAIRSGGHDHFLARGRPRGVRRRGRR